MHTSTRPLWSRPAMLLALVAFAAAGCSYRVPAQNWQFYPPTVAIVVYKDGASREAKLSSLNEDFVVLAEAGEQRRQPWKDLLRIRTHEADYKRVEGRVRRVSAAGLAEVRAVGPIDCRVQFSNGARPVAAVLLWLEPRACALLVATRQGQQLNAVWKAESVRRLETRDGSYTYSRERGELMFEGNGPRAEKAEGAQVVQLEAQVELGRLNQRPTPLSVSGGWWALLLVPLVLALGGCAYAVMRRDDQSQEYQAITWVLQSPGVAVFILMVYGMVGLALVLVEPGERLDIGQFMAWFANDEGRLGLEFLSDGQLAVLWNDAAAQKADHGRLRELFRDDREYQAALRWGAELAQSWRAVYQLELKRLGGDLAPTEKSAWLPSDEQLLRGQLSKFLNAPLTIELAGHFAWRRLTCTPGCSEADLRQLPGLVERAVPDRGAREALLEWARRRRGQKQLAVPLRSGEPAVVLAPPPPAGPWFDAWVLYDDWAVTDPVFDARRAQLLRTLKAGSPDSPRWRTFLAWGQQLIDERAGGPDALPVRGERAQAMAAVDRLAGLDGSYAKRRADKQRVFGDSDLGPRELALLLAPNDDVSMALFGDLWDRRPQRTPEAGELILVRDRTNGYRLGSWARNYFLFGCLLLLIPLLGFFIWRGAYAVGFALPAWLMGQTDHPGYRAYRENALDLGEKCVKLGLTVAVNLALILALAREPFWALHVQAWPAFVLAVLWNTVLGESFLEFLEHLSASIVLARDINPQKIYVDNVVALAGGAGVLYWFQNNVVSIAVYMVMELAFLVKHSLSHDKDQPGAPLPRGRRGR